MVPFVQDRDLTLYCGDAAEVLSQLDPDSVDVIVTSPPYFNLRDYGVAGQIGLEASVDLYVQRLCAVFQEARRVLSPTGTLWLNLADSYARDPAKEQHKVGDSGKQAYIYDKGGGRASLTSNELPAKNLLFVPARAAMALQAEGWWVRQDVIWEKVNALPESVADRPGLAHEHLFMLTKAERYHYDREAVKVPAAWERWGAQTPRKTNNGDARGAQFVKERTRQEVLEIAGERNLRSVWSIPTEPNTWAACDDCDSVFTTTSDGERHEQMTGHTLAPHFAAFPRKLVETCLRASAPPGGTVLDPFMGSGTTMAVARALGLNSIGIELREAYCRMIRHRAQQLSFLAEPIQRP